MRIQHRVPTTGFSDQTHKVDPDYQAKVETHTHRAEVEYARAAKRLEKAEERRDRARLALETAGGRTEPVRVLRRALKEAEEMVLKRSWELQELHRMMRSSPSSQSHRGRGQYRPPVPAPGEIV